MTSVIPAPSAASRKKTNFLQALKCVPRHFEAEKTNDLSLWNVSRSAASRSFDVGSLEDQIHFFRFWLACHPLCNVNRRTVGGSLGFGLLVILFVMSAAGRRSGVWTGVA